MRNKKVILYILMFLPLIITICALPFLQDTVVIHFDMSGNPDGYASKNTLFILPVLCIGIGILTTFIGNNGKVFEGRDTKNKKPAIVIGIGALLVLNTINILLIYIGVNGMPSGNLFNPNTLLSVVTSIAIIIMGNIMPKTQRGNMIGLRTSWSRASDDAWAVSQRISGIIFVITGFVVLALNIFVVPTELNTAILTLALIIGVTLSLILSKVACNKLSKKHKEVE